MSNFFRFPHTPHLKWLGDSQPRDDKVLSPAKAQELLAGNLVIEEKLDGANLGFSLAPDGNLCIQNRGHYLHEPYSGQFSQLGSWLNQHAQSLNRSLNEDLILFGEWCAARHSLDYDSLPDLFLLFDVYERSTSKFWSTAKRNQLAVTMGLATVPFLMRGHVTLPQIENLLITESSRFRSGPLEGVVMRKESSEWCEIRAKLVRPDFTQAITEHWSRKRIAWNKINNS